MAHVPCSDCLFVFFLFRKWVLPFDGSCFMPWLPFCFFLLFSWWVLLAHGSSFSSYFCSVNLFTNIITIRHHLQHISFRWCRHVWFIILLAYLTLVLGPPLYATPHYDWSFLLFSSMISVMILISYLVSLLVLDLTSVMSQSSPTIQKPLDLAYFQGRECGLFTSVKEIFPEPHQAYSLEQYDLFISHNRLGMSHFFPRNTFLHI
jgi:hypothetical protein